MFGRIPLTSILLVASTAFGQDIPDRNPEQNSDGTQTYWCGNNMQWEIQEAIDDCNSGDIIVIRAGSYVDTIIIDKPNITVRPFVTADGEWEEVNFWNPTKGPQNDNGWGVYLGANTENTYIGRPRQFRQLESGYVSVNTVIPGEYSAADGEPPIEIDKVTGICFSFWSRSTDNTGLMSNNGKATIENCLFTSQNGFGGGVILTGNANTTAFVDCEFESLYADGQNLHTDIEGLDLPNYAIAIHDGAGIMDYTFSNCTITNNRGSTIVYQSGGHGSWNECRFDSNQADTNFSGTLTLLGCNPEFSNCTFYNNLSGYGTVFMNGEGVSSLDGVRFQQCIFDSNATIDGQWGGVIYAIDTKDADGTPPKVMFDNCIMMSNNGNDALDQDDLITPYFPTYRQGQANRRTASQNDDGPCTPNADLDGNGIVNGADLGILFILWGTNGEF